jgi:hypothetical protein
VFCFDLEPVFLTDDLKQRLEPDALVLTRAEFNTWVRSQPLDYVDAYRPWRVDAEFVALLTPAEIAALEPTLRLELNAAQVRLERGLMFPLEIARKFRVPAPYLERDSAGDSFLLRADARDALARADLFDWLEWHVTQDGIPCVSSSLTMHARKQHRAALDWVGWEPSSGANCFATASIPTVGARHASPLHRNLARLWCLAETFRRALESRGYAERPFTSDLERGDVLVWRDSSGTMVHACVALGDGLVLNKDSQAWYAPRQLLEVDTVLERWREDGLEVSVFRPV